MELSTPFVIKDLPDNSWSVSWPGYEYNLVNNAAKAQHLLEILFETIKVQTSQLAVFKETWSQDKTEILHVDVAAWWQDQQGLAQYLSEFVVTGVKFETLNEAQRFKDHMDQRLAWKRLGGEWK